MSETEPIPNPLPTRFGEVKAKRDIMKQGIVPLPQNKQETFDISNAAQSIIIDPVLESLIEEWERPTLPETGSFYTNFGLVYFKHVEKEERRIWIELVQSVVSNPNLNTDNLTEIEAATLTLVTLPAYENIAVSSQELFVELALHAEVLVKKITERDGECSPDVFYTCLRESFPKFLKRLIALDSVLLDYYRSNMMSQDRTVTKPHDIFYIESTLDERFFDLDASNRFMVNPRMMMAFKKLAQENQSKEDNLGRTKNRGCPFLVSDVQDEFIAFAIEELIAQHKKMVT